MAELDASEDGAKSGKSFGVVHEGSEAGADLLPLVPEWPQRFAHAPTSSASFVTTTESAKPSPIRTCAGPLRPRPAVPLRQRPHRL